MNTLEVKVHAIRLEAGSIHSFELRAIHGASLPAFTAGAHVEVHMSEHLQRSYSLANSPGESDRYEIAVNKEPSGRGGSRYMHEQVRVGQILRISEPRNNFELNESAQHTVLIAGGIGVTPLRSMIARLQTLGAGWTLYYCGRERGSMAYLPQLQQLADQGANIHFNVDSENGGRFLDMAQVIGSAPANSHFYCCGPKPMLSAFEAATSGMASERVHVEYFTAKEAAAADGGFVVQLVRSGRTIPIVVGKSILDTLLDAGVDVPFSCMDGICGSCEVRVLAGIPDHRDSILSQAERDANDKMLVCCSGSKSETLVLDL